MLSLEDQTSLLATVSAEVGGQICQFEGESDILSLCVGGVQVMSERFLNFGGQVVIKFVKEEISATVHGKPSL